MTKIKNNKIKIFKNLKKVFQIDFKHGKVAKKICVIGIETL